MESGPADQFIVETPENIRFGYDVADIGSRFLAVLIDTLIIGVLEIVFSFSALVVGNQLTQLNLPPVISDNIAVVFILASFFIFFGYFMVLEVFLNGATPGKRLFHLRVIKDNGYPLGPLDAIIRNLIRVIDFFPALYGVGVVVMFLNKRAKRLGDFAAGTLVVKMRDQVRLQNLMPALSPVVAPPNVPAAASAMDDVRRLSENDVELAETFLVRRAQMTDPAPMSMQIAQRLADKMQLPVSAVPQTADAAVVFIRTTVAAFRAPRV